jgi:hypothetical protein
MSNPIITYITPVTKEGEPDNRFSSSMERIIDELDEVTIEELRQFARDTAVIQRRAASAGLRLATAVFREAAYLDKHHRFDEDNKFGWRSKTLRRQAQQILEQVGFKKNNAHKLVAAAAWLTSKHFAIEEKSWFGSLTPSHIYELCRMNNVGYERVKQQVCFPGFTFSAGQQEIAVRTLESIRRQYPSKEVERVEQIPTFLQQDQVQIKELQTICGEETLERTSHEVLLELERLQPSKVSDENSNKEMIKQFTQLAQAIDWTAIKSDNESRELLTSIKDTIQTIANLPLKSIYLTAA